MAFECSRVTRIFRGGSTSVAALLDVSMSVADGEFICIVGPSGCGKTTLLRLIAGLDSPTTGSIDFDHPLAPGQLRAAMVFQHVGLFPWMTILANVGFGLEMHGVSKAECQRRAKDFLNRVGLAGFEHKYPHQLSGGMRQRAAILRAFLTDSELLLMDEPFAALDSQTRLVMQEELLQIWRENRRTVLYVTHDIEEAILLGDKVIVMTGRPGSVHRIVPIDLKRPRQLADRRHPDVAELRLQIWKMLEKEVRRELELAAQ